MRMFAVTVALVASTGCSTVATFQAGSNNGIPYVLPKGVVPIQVFADATGIGLTIEPSRIVVDHEPGRLVARLSPSPFNNEDIKLGVDPLTGFLTTITSNSDAKLLAIVEEAAKSTARLALQNSRASFLATRVVVLDDSFDPLNTADVERVNRAVNAAFRRAADAFPAQPGKQPQVQPITISVQHPDGSAVSTSSRVDVARCEVGICARTPTSVRISVAMESALDIEPRVPAPKPLTAEEQAAAKQKAGPPTLASKIVTLPSREVIAVPVPGTILADQDITISIKDGVVDKYDLKRDSTLLGLVKIPGAILSGLVAGVTQNLTDQKSIIDKRKELAASEEGFAKAVKSRNDAVAAANVGETAVALQNATGTPSPTSASSYQAATLTIYPFSEALNKAIADRMADAEATDKLRRAGSASTSGAAGKPSVQPAPQPPAPPATPDAKSSATGNLLSPAGKMQPDQPR